MKLSYILIFLLLSLISCTSINIQQEKQQIQDLMNLVAAAHFEKNGTKFYSPNASKWWDVRGGQVVEITKENAISNTQSYLNNMEFLELAPSHDPIIEISKDGSMASYIGSIHLKGRYISQPVLWIVSWQSVLKKEQGQWQIIQIANTEMPKAKMGTTILQKVKNSLGKEKKVADISSIHALADCKGPGGNFITLLQSDSINTRFEQKSGNRHSIIGINEARNWSFSSTSQAFNENLDTLTQLFAHGHELHWLSLHPETRFQNPVFKGFQEFDDLTAFEVEFTDKLNRPVRFYYDFERYRPLGFVVYTGTLTAGETVSVHFMNWEIIEGISVFKEAEFRQGEFVYKYDYTKIELNKLNKTDFENRGKRL